MHPSNPVSSKCCHEKMTNTKNVPLPETLYHRNKSYIQNVLIGEKNLRDY
jgi:hypothetical protein